MNEPKGLSWLQLGVVLGMIGLACAFIVQGPGDTQQALEAMSYSNDGVSGVISTGMLLFKWFLYGLIFLVFACGACLVLSALGILTTIGEKLARGVAYMVSGVSSSLKPAPSTLDAPIGKKQDGTPITLGEYLKKLAEKISSLEAKTAALPPPPKPKTPEEVIEELRAEVEKLKQKEPRA